LLLLLAILAAVLWLPSPWGLLIVVGAAIVEAVEVWFWVWWTRRRKPVVGAEALRGAVGIVSTPLDPRGQVRVAGELWRARSERPADPGERVVIQEVEPDLTLLVTPEQRQDAQ
jgi:membrane protein implicated in regulation of membrane protease activity